MFLKKERKHEKMAAKRRRTQTMAEYEKTLIKDAYTFFINEKRAENLSQATLKIYDVHITSFIETMEIGNLSCALLNDNPTLYLDWIEYLQNEKRKKDVTIASYCRSVRAFLYWLQDNNYTDPIPLKIPKYQKTVKVCYTADELTTLLKKPKNCSEVEYQTWVFVNLICSTGLRLSSALSIKVADVSYKEKAVYIQQTKNNKAQVLFLNDNVLSIIKKYVALFDLNKEDFLFCTAEKTQLAIRTMEDNVATYNRKRGIEKTSIHLFRHTFAKNYYAQTKDIY